MTSTPGQFQVKPDGSRTYPDLLAFPPRAGQDSPAGSSTSTAPDSTRLPLQSPVMLPPHLAGFGTLPYARSHSPFSPGMSAPVMGSCGSLPIVTSRQGYVTIPRRPRAPSWAAPPRPGDPLLKVEPIYDNLGPRTTADGSSVLSLNKTGEGGTLTRTPNRGNIRSLPSTPQPNIIQPLPQYYAPIEEVDPVPSPAPIRHKIKPSPKVEEPKNRVVSWTRSSPEGGNKRIVSPNREESPKVKVIPSPRSSITTEPTDGSLRKNPNKIPPKVPPKPKKKSQPINGGLSPQNSTDMTSEADHTLFEDEGEDGTEV